MQDAAQNQGKTAGPGRLVKVWDLPTRLFHWLLVGLVIASFVSGAIGGNAMQYHQWSGLAILVLLLFRLAWGLGMPVVSNVVGFKLGAGAADVTREAEAGALEVYDVPLPCVIGAAKGLNAPRYPKFTDVVKARKKRIDEIAKGGRVIPRVRAWGSAWA